jgi:DNA repair protein RAD5
MGLGKTIEMLSLVHSHKADLANLPNAGPTSVNNLPRLANNSAAIQDAPATTLVVAPLSLLAQWQSEAEKASKPGSLKIMVYYGSDKAVNLQSLCCEANAASAPNIIVTSYGSVLSEFNQVAASGVSRGGSGGLFSLNYFRIILDEAHYIKNRQAKTAKACYELRATHRWVLTGTPIVNRLEDLFSLVHFLRVEPWSNFSFWKTFITVPFESKNFLQALNVVQTVLEPLVLRRTKDMKTPDGEPLVPLPPKTIIIDRIDLSEAEKQVYDYIFNRAKRTMAANIEAGTLLKSYTTIFAQILRLRQSCCHPILTRNKGVVAEEEDAAAASDIANGLADDMDLQSLIERFEAQSEEEDANNFGAHVLKQIQDEASDECPICSEEVMEKQTVTGCWHSACKACLLSYIDHQRSKGEVPKCFNCREPINARDVFEVIRHDYADDHEEKIFKNERGPGSSPRISLRRIGVDASAKIGALMTHLNRVRKEDSSMKSVVFSQFTSFLDLIQPALTRDRIQYLRFDGSMSQKSRAAVLDEFRESKKGVVLLLSLRAGGVGLNLTAAKRVFMMDPWWSFAVEAQAIDRIHRMGQDEEVVVTRFIARESIEEKMLRIQERKMFM